MLYSVVYEIVIKSARTYMADGNVYQISKFSVKRFSRYPQEKKNVTDQRADRLKETNMHLHFLEDGNKKSIQTV